MAVLRRMECIQCSSENRAREGARHLHEPTCVRDVTQAGRVYGTDTAEMCIEAHGWVTCDF